MENKISTAEEFLIREDLPTDILSGDDINYAMIEFAKLHVEAALKAVAENVVLEGNAHWVGTDSTENKFNNKNDVFIQKDSILNSYPLDNIK